jgi:DnaK suppressor protein
MTKSRSNAGRSSTVNKALAAVISASMHQQTKTKSAKKKAAVNKASVQKTSPAKTKGKGIAAKSTKRSAVLSERPSAEMLAKPAPKSIKKVNEMGSSIKTSQPKVKKSKKESSQGPELALALAQESSVKHAAAKDAYTSSPSKVGGTGFLGIKPYEVHANEEYMSEKQLQHFKNILLAWRQSLMEEVDRTVHHMKEDASNLPDPNDRATQEEEFSLELRTRDRERKLIKKIEETLERIEADDYGFCDMCGVDIGIRRLEARPTATLCIDCKTMDEIREKQGAV